jgi:hypothetical protein
LLQKEATHRIIITKDRTLTTNNSHIIPNTRHIISNTRPLTTNHANEIPIIPNTRLFTTNHAIANNIHFAKKQTPLTSHGQINTINKNNTYKDKKKHKLDKIPIVEPPTKNSREKVTKQKPICYKYKKIGHYQNNCVSDKNCRS